MGKEKVNYLFSINNIHNNSSLQHTSQASLDREVLLARCVERCTISICGSGWEFGGHFGGIVEHLLLLFQLVIVLWCVLILRLERCKCR